VIKTDPDKSVRRIIQFAFKIKTSGMPFHENHPSVNGYGLLVDWTYRIVVHVSIAEERAIRPDLATRGHGLDA
jgi:hypothetical protein